MRFQLIDRARKDFPVHRLCRILGVSQSGYFAWKDHPPSRHQRDDMVMLAHVRSAFALSNGTYGSPRMTRELQDDGCAIGRRHTALLMRENGLRGRQKRRFKRTTDSEHAWPIASKMQADLVRRSCGVQGRLPRFAHCLVILFFCPIPASSLNQISIGVPRGKGALTLSNSATKPTC